MLYWCSRLTNRWIPKVFQKKAEKEDTGGEVEKKWILKGVECDCHSGEVLAM
jgi:hypothetical protein